MYVDEKEYLVKRIKELKIWKEENKQYILQNLYIQKIKEYFLKEYGGEILSDPSVRDEYCSDYGDSEEYHSKLYITIHFKQRVGEINIADCVSFCIDYDYIIYKKDSKLWETFDAYRKSDNVYLQGGTEEHYPKEYRYEYNRAWQEGGLQKIYTSPK